jgi:hypothetical protein
MDGDSTLEFAIDVIKFTNNDVLCLTIVCIPDALDINDNSIKQSKIEHENLIVKFNKYNESIHKQGSTIEPMYHNGSYEYALTWSHGIKPDKYILSITNTGQYVQSIKVSYQIVPYVKSTTLQLGSNVIINNIHRNEIKYFRYTHNNPENVLIIYITPIVSNNNQNDMLSSDPDIYITNRYNGLINVTKTNYVWNSNNMISNQIYIHPQDIESQRNNVYVIGVFGFNDIAKYDIRISEMTPEPITTLQCDTELELWITPSQYHYLSLPVNTSFKGKVCI